MALNNFDDDQFNQDNFESESFTPEPEKKRSNRTFMIAIGVVGAIFVLALVLLLLVAPRLIANQRAAQQEQAAQINAANTATAMAATALYQQQATLAAKTTVAPVKAATKTPMVVVLESTAQGGEDVSALSAAELATVSALQTQMAGLGNINATSTAQAAAATATALPDTGFADEVGLPVMAGLAVILVVVIFLSRRLRLTIQ